MLVKLTPGYFDGFPDFVIDVKRQFDNLVVEFICRLFDKIVFDLFRFCDENVFESETTQFGARHSVKWTVLKKVSKKCRKWSLVDKNSSFIPDIEFIFLIENIAERQFNKLSSVFLSVAL